jgi:ribosome-binding protein aMBF1 (putative translation factor)
MAPDQINSEAAPHAPTSALSRELMPSPNAAAAPEGWNVRLRNARKEKELSRRAAAIKLKLAGSPITAEAIKKHEEGRARPKKETRKAYALAYEMSENQLFPSKN